MSELERGAVAAGVGGCAPARDEADAAEVVVEVGPAADGVAHLISQLGLPNHLAAYELSEDDLREAVRPVASADRSENDLLGILRAAL